MCANEPSRSDAPAASAGAAPPRVVVVDDDADFLEVMQVVLASAGYAVTAFAEPQKALAAMAVSPPDLLVTDLMMGRMDSGFSLARAVKQHARLAQLPVIIVSGITRQRGYDFSPEGADDLAAMCADAFFDKPVQPEALLAKAQELLARRALPAPAAAHSP